MKKIALSLVTILLVLGLASASMAWTLVYSHDGNGNPSYGNLQDLIDAVDNGKQVRFLIDYGISRAVMEAELVQVRNGGVHAMFNQLLSAGWNGSKVVPDPPAYASHVQYNVDTNGNLTWAYWLVGEHSQPFPNGQYNYPIKWFVQ